MPAPQLAVLKRRVWFEMSPGARSRGLQVLVGALWIALSAACSHDLDKLRAKRGSGGSAAPDASAPSAGAAGGVTDVLAACQPCKPPTGLAELVTPIACCTSSKDPQCGVSFGTSRCFFRNAPGLPDGSCPDLMSAGIKFSGCCGFDLQCGVKLDALALGCMARQDVPALLGGPLAPRSCVPKCSSDKACAEAVDVSICAEDASHVADARFCAYSCKSDRDCAAVAGTVCAVQQNMTERRIDAVCRKPFGTGLLGDPCSSTNDCAHGLCFTSLSYCSQLCRTDLDCEGTGSQCKPSSIPLPPPAVGTQPFNVCVAKK